MRKDLFKPCPQWDWRKTLNWAIQLDHKRRHDPKSVMDLNPDGPVTWTEVYQAMRDHGWIGTGVDARFAWQDIVNKYWPC